MSAASLIATHMNAPYGRVLSAQDVVVSLQQGHLSAACGDANDILAMLFTEVDPSLILQCAAQENVPLASVNRLYEETLCLGGMKSAAWEQTVGALD
ncbi:Uncharacterised protein [Delftia tsuruhatensis]|uniref:hypothetical protein n=1 Tax=Delftia tsuruhatensis TaxID=180282 RepID=UPI001E7A94C3|nr:hypothetical protein [Delftia tsuruhatensis]CAB5713652.1 Uncharacterised protein [Delftia tsuruhatensis]CAC9688688.1 Uncharacterised protein [Delftia tsuruhatensis]